jgi:HEAT repeat protein
MLLSISLQSLRGWEIDWISLGLGVFIGILLTIGVQRALPVVRRWQKGAVDRVRQSVSWVRTGVESRYLSETVEYAQSYHLGAAWAQLGDVYVPPRLLIPESAYDPFHDEGASIRHLYQLWPELAFGVASPTRPTASVDDLLRNGRRVIITAGPGAGKSALLAYCALQTAQQALAALEANDPETAVTLPVLLHIAELDLSPNEEGELPDPAQVIISALQKRVSPITSPGLKDLIPKKLKNGRLRLLLDGYDNLNKETRKETAEWLSRLLAQYPEAQIFVASSASGYGLLIPLEFITVTILPWRAGAAETFGQKWADALKVKPSRTTRFWQPGQTALKTSLRLWHDLIIQRTRKGTAALPPSQWADLMENILPLLAGNGKLDAPVMPPETAVLTFWQRIAYELQSAEKTQLTRVELENLAAEMAEAQPDLSAAKYQKSVTNNRLFQNWANGTTSFFSHVWQDYLTAGHMAANNMIDQAKDHAYHSAWDGVLRFYTAQAGAGATDLAEYVLSKKDASPTRDALFRVASWMPEATDSGEWRRQTLILLGQMIRQATFAPVLRLRAVAALAQTGEPGVLRFMQQLLERSDSFLRLAGVVGLSALPAERALPLLDDRLYDDDALVRETAVYALSWLYHPAAERPLITALISDDETISHAAAESLALNGGTAWDILKEALKEESVYVRRAAIMGISMLDEEWVLPLLANTERLDNEWIVQSAANMAQEIVRKRQIPGEWRPLQIQEQSWLQDYARDEGRVVPDGQAALPFLVQVLTESSWPNLRMAAARTLGQIPTLDALPALETAVRDDDDSVRDAAFTTLCHIRQAFT